MRLGLLISDHRFVHRIGVRELAKEIGTSSATLSRFERDGVCDSDTLTAILQWAFGPGDPRRTRDTDG